MPSTCLSRFRFRKGWTTTPLQRRTNVRVANTRRDYVAILCQAFPLDLAFSGVGELSSRAYSRSTQFSRIAILLSCLGKSSYESASL